MDKPERQYTEKDGTVVTEGEGWCELDFSNSRSLTQIVQNIVQIVRKIERESIIVDEAGEEERQDENP